MNPISKVLLQKGRKIAQEEHVAFREKVPANSLKAKLLKVFDLCGDADLAAIASFGIRKITRHR